MGNRIFSWAEGKQDALASQLVTIGNNLAAQGPLYGVTAADIAYWQTGAAVNSYLQTQLIEYVRDLSTGITASRDELQLDKTVENYVLPTFNPPTPPTIPTGVVLQTDFLDWADKLYQKMKLNGLSESGAKTLGFLVSSPTSDPNPATMQPRIRSIHTEAGGKVLVDVERQNQPQIKCKLTLDTGEIYEKTLPNSRFAFTVLTDRVHGFNVSAIYVDKNGDTFGNWSDPKSDSSEI